MQQTLLALLGLLVVTMLSFSQQQANIRSQQQAFRAEYRQMALGVAKQTLGVIRTRAFDHAVKDGEEDVENFTKESSSEWGGKNCIDSEGNFSDTCSAIEHFHDDESRVMDNPDGMIQVKMPGHTLSFQVEIEVHYVEEDGSTIVRVGPGDAPTRLKEVTVRVQDCPAESAGDSCDGTPFLPSPISLTEVFGYTGG